MPAKIQIDLIGYAGFTSFDDVKSHLTTDANGNAVITLADGQSITLYGVAAAFAQRVQLRVRSDARHEQRRDNDNRRRRYPATERHHQ